MTHLWMRAETRPFEERAGLTPEGVAQLTDRGIRVTVEHSRTRILPIDGYAAAGAELAEEGSWPEAPDDAIIFGLKELPEDGTPLHHRHIMFGHAYKGQPAGQILLRRFRAGGGTLHDLEYLLDADGRRVAAFGYWAGYVGAAVSLKCWAAQRRGGICGPVSAFAGKDDLIDEIRANLDGTGTPPRAIVIGALGRVGTGARDFCTAVGVPVTSWDMAETAHGGPFPEIAAHEVFLNCILAGSHTPVFVPREMADAPRALSVIGDIACDPTSDFSPIKIYDQATDWGDPALRVRTDPVLDVMAIDNLPSLLPLESSEDFARQLLPFLKEVGTLDGTVWGRAEKIFKTNMEALQ
ncbi:saccharopine dehydrogenase [Pseudooceanicola aestuarii]|uniref:saccharopine dehydrogenase n=1 Tax=Pseudooceanicola aestuarii TaxID=2697319 RepID=UPI0013D44B7E|nr:saccharopine dehydrogenase [Pseudooceanicola aestuarii]